MSLKSLALAGIFSLVAGAALADPIQVKLATPVTKSTEFFAGGMHWSCDGDTCWSGEQSMDAFAVDACLVISKKLGVVSSYADDVNKLSAANLAKCNAGRVTATAMPAGSH